MTDVLVLGSGGREHAVVHALNKSSKVGRVYCAPGNAGIAKEAECVNIGVMQFEDIAQFLLSHPNITLTVATPDNPLVDGIVDYLTERGHRTFGPQKAAALIEGSKLFAKRLMKENGIPTADYEFFDDYTLALEYIKKAAYPLVVKADGLAFGKGVIICSDYLQAQKALTSIMCDATFGKSNRSVVIEQFLVGREVTLLAFTDGKTVSLMPSAQDHKRAGDGDTGLNTGGMGAFSPSPYFTKELLEKTKEKIVYPTIKALNNCNRTFKGVLYFGLMICNGKPYVIEYNARFGDPETQAILPLLNSDLYDILNSVVDENLSEVKIEWRAGQAVSVVLASEGYPGAYATGSKIEIIDTPQVEIYHAGTKQVGDSIVTSGGRVLAVTAVDINMEKAREKVYGAIKNISFDGMFYRNDIGIK
ncbi:MAG: phosphoribosylamine--glycine ligase [Christensenellaceae bacterium]|jgi:phosphoribosylamine--glycine ligase|nr:phosphoribosylamine--glycine ligase [Christensenellaceae bacterium]